MSITNGKASTVPVDGASQQGSQKQPKRPQFGRENSSLGEGVAKVLYERLPDAGTDFDFIKSIDPDDPNSKQQVKEFHQISFEKEPLVFRKRVEIRQCGEQVKENLQRATDILQVAVEAVKTHSFYLPLPAVRDKHLDKAQVKRLAWTSKLYLALGVLFVVVDYCANTVLIEGRLDVAMGHWWVAIAMSFIPTLAPLVVCEFWLYWLDVEKRENTIRLLSRVMLAWVLIAISMFAVNLGLAAEAPDPMGINGGVTSWQIPWWLVQPVLGLALIAAAVGCFEVSRSKWQARFALPKKKNPEHVDADAAMKRAAKVVESIKAQEAELGAILGSLEKCKKIWVDKAVGEWVTLKRKVRLGRKKSDDDELDRNNP